MQIILNEDKELVKEIQYKLKETNGFCPCSLIHNDSYRCICLDFRNMIKDKKYGEYCHCGLYKIEE